MTERIQLVSDILIVPLRSNTALFVYLSVTIDSLSGRRLTLVLAPAGRWDDFEACGVDFSLRGRIFAPQLDDMTAVWHVERRLGPAPRQDVRPWLLIGWELRCRVAACRQVCRWLVDRCRRAGHGHLKPCTS